MPSPTFLLKIFDFNLVLERSNLLHNKNNNKHTNKNWEINLKIESWRHRFADRNISKRENCSKISENRALKIDSLFNVLIMFLTVRFIAKVVDHENVHTLHLQNRLFEFFSSSHVAFLNWSTSSKGPVVTRKLSETEFMQSSWLVFFRNSSS